MATIHLIETTTSTPEQFIAGLTDFGPGRKGLWGNSADDYLEVYAQGPGYADVKEGSGGIWKRLHYDWSDPNHVVLTTTDSNLSGGNSGHTYTFRRNPDGGTDIDVVIVREGKNLRGRVLAFVIGIIGKGYLKKDFGKTVKAIEARNNGHDDHRALISVARPGASLCGHRATPSGRTSSATHAARGSSEERVGLTYRRARLQRSCR
jgi:hypothetical protein